MKIVATTIPDVKILEPAVFGDARGFFMEIYQSQKYAAAGIDATFVQDNLSRSSRGVVRGLHLQNPHCQGKLVAVLSGEVLDVAVDVRIDSPTFMQHVAVNLSDVNRRQLWVPRGFAHGFAVLSETADFFYKCDELYSAESELTIRWNDPELKVAWPFPSPTLSSRDASAPSLREMLPKLPRYKPE